jgi:uncharacterized protein YbbC (DUF1343 family)
MNGQDMAEYLNHQYVPGVRAYPIRFTPTASNFAGKPISGVRFVITDRNAFDSIRLGLEVAKGIAKLYPGKMDWNVNRTLVGSHAVLEHLAGTETAQAIQLDTEAELKGFLEKRKPYLLY